MHQKEKKIHWLPEIYIKFLKNVLVIPEHKINEYQMNKMAKINIVIIFFFCNQLI